MTTEPSALPSEIAVRRSDPVYMAHGYLTKVPVAAVIPFIQAFTSAGDLVLDPFAGSGMTGVAAVMTGRRAAVTVDKILRGARPADLPVERPTRSDFAINLQAAQALGLTILPSVLQQATELIQ